MLVVPKADPVVQSLDTGWRRQRERPSLAEVFGTIGTRPTGPMWRKLLAELPSQSETASTRHPSSGSFGK